MSVVSPQNERASRQDCHSAIFLVHFNYFCLLDVTISSISTFYSMEALLYTFLVACLSEARVESVGKLSKLRTRFVARLHKSI